MAKIIQTNGSDEWFARQRETAEVGAAAIENIFEGRAAEAAAEQARKERRERFRTRLAVIGLIVAVLALIVAVLAIAITAGWISWAGESTRRMPAANFVPGLIPPPGRQT